MSLIIGADKIKSIYVADNKISKAYIGNDLVFSSGPPSRLPAGYTEVEYIYNAANSSGVRAVTTNMNLGSTLTPYISMAARRYELDLILGETGTSSKPNILFGSNLTCNYKGSTGGGSTGTLTKGNASYVDTYSSSTTSYIRVRGFSDSMSSYKAAHPVGTRFSLIILTPTSTSSSTTQSVPIGVNGVAYTITTKVYALSSSLVSKNWCMFGYLYAFTSTTSSSCTIGAGVPTPMEHPMYLYSFKVYDTSSGTNVLINDWVPCKNSSGKAGLIDLISKNFVTNYNSAAPFSAGPTV